MLEAKIEGGKLIVSIDMAESPAPSASGKTLVLASSHGNQATALVWKGKAVTVGLNAYVKA